MPDEAVATADEDEDEDDGAATAADDVVERAEVVADRIEEADVAEEEEEEEEEEVKVGLVIVADTVRTDVGSMAECVSQYSQYAASSGSSARAVTPIQHPWYHAHNGCMRWAQVDAAHSAAVVDGVVDGYTVPRHGRVTPWGFLQITHVPDDPNSSWC
jgi:hypothetical protein